MAVVLILITLVVVLMSFVYIRISKQKGLPPGPMSLPVLGSVWMLKKMSSGKPYLVFMEESKKYGNIMSFMIGRERVVVLISRPDKWPSVGNLKTFFSRKRSNELLFKMISNRHYPSLHSISALIRDRRCQIPSKNQR